MRRAHLAALATLTLGLAATAHAVGGATSTSTPTPTATATRPPLALADLPLAMAPAAPPLALTAGDGTGLRLVALEARAVVADPLAFTELRLVFENPRDAVLEGQFRITLPPGAAVSRFAMREGAEWKEGEVVELARARRAYEDFLHRRQDPALLEQAPGNAFAARVFPIPPRGQKELVVSWSQELGGGAEPYRLPLAGLPRVGRLDVSVLDLGGEGRVRLERHAADVVPAADLGFTPARRPGAAVRAGDLAVVRVRPAGEARADPLEGALVLVDTSASRALGLPAQAALVTALAAALPPDAPLVVVAFDQEQVVLHDGPAGRLGGDLAARLAARGALGASDLAGALERARAHLASAARPQRLRRVVLVTDGVATAGPDDGAALGAAAAALRTVGVERLDAVVVGGIRDEEALARLARAGLPRDGGVVDGELPPAEVVSRLGRATRSGVAVEVPGAEWVWPARLDGVFAGDERLVFAALPAGAPLTLTLDGVPQPVSAALAGAAEAPLVARAAARARIAALLAEREALPAEEGARRDALRDAVVALSVKERVLSPFTALLVLEAEDDYARFGIDRRALARILSVGPEGLVLQDRAPLQLAQGARRVEVDRRPPREAEADAGSAPGAPATTADHAALADAAPPPPGAAAAEEAAPLAAATARPEAAPARAAPAAPPSASPRPRAAASDRQRQPLAQRVAPERPLPRKSGPPVTGPLAEVLDLLARGEQGRALARARAWRAAAPGDVLALLALGEALERGGDLAGAARAYGSIVDLFPDRADLRRLAGNRLERLAHPAALALAIDTYARAAAQRPDHPGSHRLLAFALLRAGRHEAAFAALEAGLARSYPEGRFRGVRGILEEDLGLVAAAWARAEPGRAAAIAARREAAGGVAQPEPSLRFVLSWETDANDVDFHVTDGRGDRAYFAQPELPSGGRLHADVTTGYGPECFSIRGAAAAGPYHLEAHYYARGPMGYGMGKLEVIRHDGRGGLTFDERPFVVMEDGAYVDLGTVR